VLTADAVAQRKDRRPSHHGELCGWFKGTAHPCARGLTCMDTNIHWASGPPLAICCYSGEEVSDPSTGMLVCNPKPCPPGLVRKGFRGGRSACVPPPPCPMGQHRDPATGQCVPDPTPPPPCPQGQHRDPATGQCVDDLVPLPPPPPLTCEQLGKLTRKRQSDGAVTDFCADACGDASAGTYECPLDPPNPIIGTPCCARNQTCYPKGKFPPDQSITCY
jgi:hypothetical protein